MNDRDHDILIRVAANLDTLCKKIDKVDSDYNKLSAKLDKVDQDNKDEHKEIREMIDTNARIAFETKETVANESRVQIEKCHSKFLHTKVFLWIAGFMIAGIIGSYSFTNIVFTDLKNHQVEDAKIMNEFINRLQEFEKTLNLEQIEPDPADCQEEIDDLQHIIWRDVQGAS
jgi:hypothetical protein